MKRSLGFTLIEMLLVVSLIALLISLLLPALAQSRGVARVAVCANQLHQLHGAIVEYQQRYRMRKPWQFANGSADYPHESGSGVGKPGTPARALVVSTKILPDARLLFCPDIPAKYETIYNPAPNESFVQFHATYSWHHQKVRAVDDATPSGNSILWANPISKDLILVDNAASTWASWGYPYSYPHYNALMLGGEVRMITRVQSELSKWLWGPEGRPY